ncbi:MAG: NADH-quinone oxidoreductase subunit J [Acidobacteria bacterium]|nr:NADH-quinone oxidoreductase subunit J [Acidobacteriota bacterium]
MSLSHAVFFALAAVTMASAVMAITRRNVVHSAVFLIITLLAVGGLYLQLEAEFLFAVQVILYVGGIMVLFLFVIMLVNLEEAQKEAQFKRYWWIAVVAVLVLSAEWGYVLFRGQETFVIGPQQMVVELAGSVEETPLGNTEQIGIVLFRNYMLPFEIASLLLLVAMVGAVVMAKRRLE